MAPKTDETAEPTVREDLLAAAQAELAADDEEAATRGESTVVGPGGEDDDLASLLDDLDIGGGGSDERELSPQERHGLRVAAQKHEENEELRKKLAEKEQEVARLRAVEERLASLEQMRQPTLPQSRTEDDVALPNDVLEGLDPSVLEAMGGSSALSKVLGRVVRMAEQRAEARIRNTPEVKMTRQRAILAHLGSRSPVAERFMTNKAVIERARSLRSDPTYAREYSDAELNEQKAVLWDAVVTTLSGDKQRPAAPSRAKLDGAFSPSTGAGGGGSAALRARLKSGGRSNVQKVVQEGSDEEFGALFQATVAEAERRGE